MGAERRPRGDRQKKAGLLFPAHVIRKIAKSAAKNKVRKDFVVWLAACLDKLATELHHAAHNATKNEKTIQPEHVQKALTDKTSPVFGVFSGQISGIN
jgi:histone H3/H4